MRFSLLTSLAAAVLLAIPAAAREPADTREPDKPVTSKDVSAGDVAATPVTDLNLRKGEIPPALTAAVQQTYSLSGLVSCQQLAAEIGELDAALGDDVDLPQTAERRTSPGRVAQSVVGSFIPFRGVIREVSGAGNRERELQSAVLAGVARRAFLKGTGQARGCRYPARSATLAVYNQRMDRLSAEQKATHEDKPDSSKSPDSATPHK